MKYFILQLFILFLFIKSTYINEITITIIGKGDQKILSDDFSPLPNEIKIEQKSLNYASNNLFDLQDLQSDSTPDYTYYDLQNDTTSNNLYDLQNGSASNYDYNLYYNSTSNYIYGLQDN